jgi:hypothetical protein
VKQRRRRKRKKKTKLLLTLRFRPPAWKAPPLPSCGCAVGSTGH